MCIVTVVTRWLSCSFPRRSATPRFVKSAAPPNRVICPRPCGSSMRIARYFGTNGTSFMASRNPQTVNLGGGIYTRSQLSQMFRDGRKAFENHLATTPVAVAVEYDNTQRRVVVQLNNGCEMSVPVRLLKEVCDATPK